MTIFRKILAVLALVLASVGVGAVVDSTPAHAYLTNCSAWAIFPNIGAARCSSSNIGGLNLVRVKVTCYVGGGVYTTAVGPWLHINETSMASCWDNLRVSQVYERL
jgi:hypothetical protein